ncbi:hypothetical protein EPUL_005418 [Erysiphe pulchra]|uniref:Uncharacterized protein n=1 Tax=Erysiphe pulchra TaxID=225359 RepID=A0A2S4PKV0_9PEZI|nr:hypothetical protein EPUL_005418 [Erysiphe pulchra]
MLINSENEYSDTEMDDDLSSSPPPPTDTIPLPTSSSPQKSMTVEPGINQSIYANPTQDHITSKVIKVCTHSAGPPQAQHLSTYDTNEYAAALLVWQNAGAQHLRHLPANIAADLKAVMTRCAARVIAGFPVLDELLPSKPQNKNLVNKPAQVPNTLCNQQKESTDKRNRNDHETKSISYARAVTDGITLPDPLIRMSEKIPNPKSMRPDTIIIVRLTQDHPLRIMDTFLARKKLRSLLPRPELIKDVRIVPSGIALVAPSHADAQVLLEASHLLQPLTVLLQLKDKNCATHSY